MINEYHGATKEVWPSSAQDFGVKPEPPVWISFLLPILSPFLLLSNAHLKLSLKSQTIDFQT